jgi:glycosyltransferase involved in cell wall biosynthesis
MKNILIISAVFHPEPLTSAMMNYDLAVELAKNHNVTVLRPKPTRPIGKEYQYDDTSSPFKCITLDSYTHPQSELIGRFKESIGFGQVCKKYIREHKDEIDVVYNSSWQLFGCNIVAHECVKQGVPYIVPVQDIYPESLFTHKHYPAFAVKLISMILNPIDKYYQKHAYKIRTISDEMADYLSETRGVSRDKYLVLDNWQNDEDFTYTPITNGKTVFGYVGSVNAHSNTELIIQAFAKANLYDSELRIYGGGNHKDNCVQLVKELGLKNVLFDVVEKTQVPEVQSKVNVLVLALPTGNGGLCLPSKMTSYMLSGRPVLASVEKSATTRYILEADCGISVEPDNVDALADGFRKFAAMSIEEQNRLGDNSRLFAEEHLTKKSNLPRVIDTLIIE